MINKINKKNLALNDYFISNFEDIRKATEITSNLYENFSFYKLVYTDFVQIYSTIISEPSSLFLIIFLLPIFLYVIYFICNYLSHRSK